MDTLASSSSDARNGVGATRCRFCGSTALESFIDLGMSPLCESYVPPERLNAAEVFYPLHALVCRDCMLVQLDQYVSASDIFSDYAYFSSFSDSWVEHARRYVLHMMETFGVGAGSKVVEIASNDGYLLQHFVAHGVPVLGIEPAANVAKVAVERGIPTEVRFFGCETAAYVRREHGPANLLVGNNVLAHVPDLNDFVGGIKVILADRGIVTMEFPHIAKLIEFNQFDTIYHEHFCYFSLFAVEQVFKAHGLRLFDVAQLPTHGGSLRIYGCHAGDASRADSERLSGLRAWERANGFDRLETYTGFEEQVRETKRKLLEFLIGARRAGKTVVGYGAPGKGNTLLNYCGIRQDLLDYTVDRSPYKQGLYLPGTHIPIYHPDKIKETKPDYILILPWNIKEEIIEQLAYAREWGAAFVVPIPEAAVLP
ncbi:MAG: class I SAM-dependent methyltransferase [Rhodospirillales bacterium]|nr:class I SAM-dependent methyltransferase [Rhodospirillales bacterium]